MEGANNYDSAGIASCGHYETVSLATIHDTAGHNGNGRTPDSDCAIKIDTEGGNTNQVHAVGNRVI